MHPQSKYQINPANKHPTKANNKPSKRTALQKVYTSLHPTHKIYNITNPTNVKTTIKNQAGK